MLNVSKNPVALKIARSKTLAHKLGWLVHGDRQDVATIRAQAVNTKILEARVASGNGI